MPRVAWEFDYSGQYPWFHAEVDSLKNNAAAGNLGIGDFKVLFLERKLVFEIPDTEK